MRARRIVVFHSHEDDAEPIVERDVSIYWVDRADLIANPKGSETAGKHAAVAGIAVADQITRCPLPAEGLRELIGDPFCRRVRRHTKPQDLSPAVSHDQEPVEQPEGDGRHHKQVHGSNAVRDGVVLHANSRRPDREALQEGTQGQGGPCPCPSVPLSGRFLQRPYSLIFLAPGWVVVAAGGVADRPAVGSLGG